MLKYFAKTKRKKLSVPISVVRTESAWKTGNASVSLYFKARIVTKKVRCWMCEILRTKRMNLVTKRKMMRIWIRMLSKILLFIYLL